jgi:putative NADPH-quinone reductase
MSRRILIIQGHPDPEGGHFGHALAAAYRKGAQAAGHVVDEVRLAELDYPMLASEKDWTDGEVPESLRLAQDRIREADHLVFFFPLWLGTLPARVKAFLEQVLRPGFAFSAEAREGIGERLLKGKSARVVITMGMPGPVYRWYFGAHGYRNLKRNVLHFCGIRPVKRCFVGGVAGKGDRGRSRWLERLEAFGRKGA